MEGDVSEGKGRAVSRGVAAWDAADRQRKMRPETGSVVRRRPVTRPARGSPGGSGCIACESLWRSLA